MVWVPNEPNDQEWPMNESTYQGKHKLVKRGLDGDCLNLDEWELKRNSRLDEEKKYKTKYK